MPRPAKKPARRRPKGTGGFSYVPSKDLWRGTYVYEDEYGDRHRAEVTHRDKVTAAQKHRKLITDIESGNYHPGPGKTLGQWMTYWVESIAKARVDPKTYVDYEQVIRLHINERLGGKPLPITPAHIRGMLKAIGEERSARTMEKVYTVLNMGLKDAVREGLIQKNPCEAVVKPKPGRSTGKALTTDQARKVLLAANQAKDPLKVRWAAAFLLGARQGELLGLQWDRVDLENLTVDLCWQLQTLKLRPGFARNSDDPKRFDVREDFEIEPLYRTFALTRPKSEKSKRLVPLPEPLAVLLDDYKKTAAANPYGLVWTKPDGTPLPGKYDTDAWYEALERVNVPKVRQHDIRHTTATLLQEMGVEESVRMSIMGHNTVAAARVYAHVDLSQARKALGSLGVLLSSDAK